MRLRYDLERDRCKQVGLVVLQADETIERDMRYLLPANVELLVSRVPSGEFLTADTIRAMEGHLSNAARLLPRGAAFRAVGYACTSGAAGIGSERVAALLRSGVEAPAMTDPVSALIAALAALDVTRIALVSPYVQSVSASLRDVLEDAGVTVTAFASFEEPLEENVVRISQASVISAALRVAEADDVDAVFLSCTNLRTLGAIPEIEAQTGKPVLSSNQVLAWHLCRLIDAAPAETAPGRLFRSIPNT